MTIISSTDPYLNNLCVRAVAPPKQVFYQGKIIQNSAYMVTFSQLFHLRQMTKMIAITVLAFQSIKQSWLDAIKNAEFKKSAKPDDSILNKDVWSIIASNLGPKDLLKLRTTSTQNRQVSEEILIHKLNNFKITSQEIKIFNITDLINFFWE